MCKYLISHRVPYFTKYTEHAVRIKYCQYNEQGWGFLALSLKATFRMNGTVKAAGKRNAESETQKVSLQIVQGTRLLGTKPIAQGLTFKELLEVSPV